LTQICDDFSKFLVILDDRGAGHERERDCYFTVERIGANVYISIGSFIISEGKARQLNPLVFPLPMNDVFLI